MYQNRQAAGEALAENLAARRFQTPMVLAIPRGGIVVAAPIARRLGVRLDILVTRKIGHPANSEVAIGAVMPDGSAILDEEQIARYAISEQYLRQAIAEEYAEARRRMALYTGSQEPPAVAGRTVIVVDDGIATGYTIKAALNWLKSMNPAKIIVAVPVAPSEMVNELARSADEVICLLQPPFFMAVGAHYQEFPQNTDAEVLAILAAVNSSTDKK